MMLLYNYTTNLHNSFTSYGIFLYDYTKVQISY